MFQPRRVLDEKIFRDYLTASRSPTVPCLTKAAARTDEKPREKQKKKNTNVVIYKILFRLR